MLSIAITTWLTILAFYLKTILKKYYCDEDSLCLLVKTGNKGRQRGQLFNQFLSNVATACIKTVKNKLAKKKNQENVVLVVSATGWILAWLE